MTTAEEIIKEIKSYADPKKAEKSVKYFKTGKGEYGEGDIFIGLTLKNTNDIVKKHKNDASLTELEKMIKNPIHEVRAITLLILVIQFKKAQNDGKKQKEIVDLYLRNVQYINSWDLVDISCYKLIGAFCINQNNYSIIYKLADSDHLWSERIAIVSNLYFIKKAKKFDLTKELTLKHINHKHDLIHKAMGWMLRELGKKDKKELTYFLDKYASKLPRTTLRYSLEKLSPEQRQYYMKKKD
jgi:3-methyladenine DNA glycosylase AlkD